MIHSDGFNPGEDPTRKNALVGFNGKFQREANEHDRVILASYDELNTTLIFVCGSRRTISNTTTASDLTSADALGWTDVCGYVSFHSQHTE